MTDDGVRSSEPDLQTANKHMSILRKFRIAPGLKLAALNEPADFKKLLGPLPEKCKWTTLQSGCDQLHWFVQTQAALKKGLPGVMKSLHEQNVVWIYFPKGSSGMQTDLTRDKGWDCLEKEMDILGFLTLVSLNDTWSAVGYRVLSEKDKQKAAQPKPEREIFQYVNPATKEVKLPGYLQKAFSKNKKAFAVYDKLPFTHKKEYLEWIITAKKEETRAKRVEAMMAKLTS